MNCSTRSWFSIKVTKFSTVPHRRQGRISRTLGSNLSHVRALRIILQDARIPMSADLLRESPCLTHHQRRRLWTPRSTRLRTLAATKMIWTNTNCTCRRKRRIKRHSAAAVIADKKKGVSRRARTLLALRDKSRRSPFGNSSRKFKTDSNCSRVTFFRR